MKLPRLIPVLAAALACASLPAAEKLVITVTHSLAAARPSETITVPWSEVAHALPGARLQHLVVRDAAGHSLPYQVTNVAPLEYLLNCRVEAARRQLRLEPRRSISDIGFACGFQSSQYFTTVFHRRTGLSPREFRKNTHRQPVEAKSRS